MNTFVQTRDGFEQKYLLGDYFTNARKYYLDNNAVPEPQPYLSFTNEEFDQKKNLETPIKTYIDENVAKFIKGQKSLSELDNFKEELNKMGIDKLLKLYGDAYDRYTK